MGVDEPEKWRAKVTANLLEARRKNGRIGTKKTRSGCVSCKERRVKCDEEKPECKRCIVAGRRCEGYSVSTPSSRASSTPPIQRSPSLILHVGDSQRRTYDFFISCAAPRISGPLDRVSHSVVVELVHCFNFVTGLLVRIYSSAGSCGASNNGLSAGYLDALRISTVHGLFQKKPFQEISICKRGWRKP